MSAVEAVLQHRREAAAARRDRSLSYTGEHTLNKWQVLVTEGNQEHPLDPRPSQELRNHSPDGFSWSYAGSGPAQLSLAILLDYTGDEELALAHYQEFKCCIVAALPRAGRWEIHAAHIEVFLVKVFLTEVPLECEPQSETQPPQAAPAHDDAGDGDEDGCQLHDELFPFSGYFGSPAHCRLHWLRRRILGQEKVIVIATELPTNTGTSITNRIEHLAGAICRSHRFDPQRLILIEHYPDQRPIGSKLRDSLREEHFSLVSCHREGGKFTRPQWLRLTRKQVETLFGQPLPESLLME